MALAIRSLDGGDTGRPNPAAVLAIVERVMREGDLRRGADQTDLGGRDALALLRAWLQEVGVQDGRELLRRLQEGELTHRDLHRRARQIHERKLAEAVGGAMATLAGGAQPDLRGPATALFDACLSAIPYAAAGAFLHREQRKLVRGDGDPPRVAIVADGIATVHGVSRTLEQIRERGVPGVEIEVLGTDPGVDRRLGSVCELEAPFNAGLSMGVPSLSTLIAALSDGRYDLVHVTSPGPAGIGALLMARVLDLPVIGSYHTELAAYAALRSGEAQLGALAVAGLSAFYRGCRLVLSPSEASDGRVAALGIGAERIRRWGRGVDLGRFGPGHHRTGWLAGGINVLYAGRLSREKGVELLANAFLAAHARDPRLHLVLAGGGPEEAELRSKLGSSATFLGWLEGEALPQVYTTADAFLFASATDTFGQVVLEAQASGLPVVAVDRGGPSMLIEHGVSGLLCEPDADSLADALVAVAGSPLLAQRLRRGGLAAVAGRTWEGSMAQLGNAYRELLAAEAVAASATA